MCQGFTDLLVLPEKNTGYEGLHCEYRYIYRWRRTLGGYLLQKSEEIKLSTLNYMEDHQKTNVFYHFSKEVRQARSITQNIYRVHGEKYVECGVCALFISSTRD